MLLRRLTSAATLPTRFDAAHTRSPNGVPAAPVRSMVTAPTATWMPSRSTFVGPSATLRTGQLCACTPTRVAARRSRGDHATGETCIDGGAAGAVATDTPPEPTRTGHST